MESESTNINFYTGLPTNSDLCPKDLNLGFSVSDINILPKSRQQTTCFSHAVRSSMEDNNERLSSKSEESEDSEESSSDSEEESTLESADILYDLEVGCDLYYLYKGRFFTFEQAEDAFYILFNKRKGVM